MAEVVLLLLFSLLLALAAIILEKEKAMEKAVADRDKYADELKVNKDKLKNLIATLSRTDFRDMKKELVRLNEQEQQIAHLLERLKIDESGPIPRQLDALLEKVTKLEEMSEKVVEAGFPQEPKNLEKALERVKEAQSEIVKADKDRKKALDQNKHLSQKLDNAEQGISQKDGQIANLKRTLNRAGKGTEKPACWADEKTGKPKYIYNTGLTSEGIIVRHSATPPWAIARDLPIESIPYDKILKPREFRRDAGPIFRWSEKNDCRFFVRAYDLTGPTEKAVYKRHMRLLETAFYKYEVLDGHWE
jgi:hypothetical protein